MADTTGIRSNQIKTSDKRGTQQYVQMSDGTGTSGNLPKFNADGSLTDSGVVAGGGSTSFVRETPAGTLNGSNTTFTLSNTPTSGSLIVYLNGVEQDQTRWCSVSGTTITFVVAPKSTDNLIAEYIH